MSQAQLPEWLRQAREYLKLVEALDVAPHWDFEWIPPRPQVQARIAASRPEAGAVWIGVQPGARWRSKRWPERHFAETVARLAEAVNRLKLRHVVITAVARDDLPDDGAEHFAECVRRVRQARPGASVEVLPADFRGRRECVAVLCAAGPDIYNHNIEVVERLTPAVRPQGSYRRSLEVLAMVKQIAPQMLTKSGLMVGLGETDGEILQTFADLRSAGCDLLTIGQYLQPAGGCVAVAKFYRPEEFDELAQAAAALGFASVASGPFVRSSYNAAGVFERARAARAAAQIPGFE